MTREPACSTCDWWAGSVWHVEAYKRAACQHAPPRVLMMPDRNTPGAVQPLTVRPMTMPDEKCPHYRPRPITQEDTQP